MSIVTKTRSSKFSNPIVWVALLVVYCVVSATHLVAQEGAAPANWDSWKFLIGEWLGEGGGSSAGQGTGGFKYYLDLNNRILVRTNYANYPATKDKPAFSHNDLMIASQERGGLTRATYWDNEGHVINYTATVSADTTVWTLISDTSSVAPRFRLTYTKTSTATVAIKFEFAPPGKPDAFSTYIEAAARRK
jgi:hypothetical protein